jgi:hypothetical protein
MTTTISANERQTKLVLIAHGFAPCGAMPISGDDATTFIDVFWGGVARLGAGRFVWDLPGKDRASIHAG